MVSRKKVLDLIQVVSSEACRCPAHSHGAISKVHHTTSAETEATDYAFEFRSSTTVRVGITVSKEIGMDLVNMNSQNACLMTDQNLIDRTCVQMVRDSLTKYRVNFQTFDNVRIEPTDESLKEAIDFARKGNFDAYIAVGGGSVIDTCKVANLLASHPTAELMDFVNKPVGDAKPLTQPLKPLIAVPTTAGSGSETTGVAVFDYARLKIKTGISYAALRPTLAIVDSFHTLSLPETVCTFTGFDTLCHALESFTAIPFNERSPCPLNPNQRPPYQGSNPLSDVWSRYVLDICRKYFKRAVYCEDDLEARSHMQLASTMAGVGFGNAGVHLCHGLSYAISTNVTMYQPYGYSAKYPIIPHGLAVVMTAPAVFEFTAIACKERHLEAAALLGADVTNVARKDAGKLLADTLRTYMEIMKIPNGLKALHFDSDDVSKLVTRTLPQVRVNSMAPRPQTEEDLTKLFEKSMNVY